MRHARFGHDCMYGKLGESLALGRNGEKYGLKIKWGKT